MLEILLLIYLSKRIGRIAESKGHKRGPNITFFIIMWFCGEIIGVMLGVFIFKGRIGPAYIFALMGAGLGAVIAFNVVEKLEDKSDDDDDIITIEID